MNEIHRQGHRKSEHSGLMTHHLKDSGSGHRWGGAELEESLIVSRPRCPGEAGWPLVLSACQERRSKRNSRSGMEGGGPS